ncbi:MAG: YbjN domain-containing protein [Bowdeniella nasicola]|nr:YbjN domain-containing protein [Bowdeniella nasicola]
MSDTPVDTNLPSGGGHDPDHLVRPLTRERLLTLLRARELDWVEEPTGRFSLIFEEEDLEMILTVREGRHASLHFLAGERDIGPAARLPEAYDYAETWHRTEPFGTVIIVPGPATFSVRVRLDSSWRAGISDEQLSFHFERMITVADAAVDGLKDLMDSLDAL